MPPCNSDKTPGFELLRIILILTCLAGTAFPAFAGGTDTTVTLVTAPRAAPRIRFGVDRLAMTLAAGGLPDPYTRGHCYAPEWIQHYCAGAGADRNG